MASSILLISAALGLGVRLLIAGLGAFGEFMDVFDGKILEVVMSELGWNK